jgi:hypothetical protein
MKNEINITSTALEKGIEIAKDFLDKLVMPTVEETGLLIREKVTYWRFKNQVKVLNKAKEYCVKHNIEPKTISFKLLVPLLEASSLEEDEVLQNKWAILLSNMVDSQQNVENHVFPYILGQISTNEYLFLEQVYISKQERIERLKKELRDFLKDYKNIEKDIDVKLNLVKQQIAEKREEQKRIGYPYNRDVWDLETKKRDYMKELAFLPYRETTLLSRINTPESIPEGEIYDYEISNLIRLGLIKEVQVPFANPQTLEIPRHDEYHNSDYVSVKLDVEVESNIENILTELGELFIQACSEKKEKST